MIKKITTIVTSFLLIFSAVAVFQLASAAPSSAAVFDSAKKEACGGTQLTGGGVNCDAEPQGKKINSLIVRVVNIISVIVGIVAVVMIIVSGLKLITSGGDSNAVGTARRGLLYAVVGLVVVALAQFIVRFVLSQTNNLVR